MPNIDKDVKKAAPPKAPVKGSPAKEKAPKVDVACLKCDHTHGGVTYEKGTPVDKITGLTANNLLFMKRVGTI